MLAECAAFHREQVARQRHLYNAQTVARLDPGFAFSAPDYLLALSARGAMLERFCADTMAEVDVIALPTIPVATPRIADTDTGGDARFNAVADRVGALVGPFNYLGLPALSVPIGLDDFGLPMGLQLVARPFAEGLLLRVAAALDDALGFSACRPSFPGRV
jgi:aspartyl-tRNA(Asn)/glutamyl-tRNA(Gln) amidotransferase subunit A